MPLVARVQFEVGSGVAVPTQLVFIPMLFLAAPAAVPVLVALGLALSTLPEQLRGRHHPGRLGLHIVSASYAVGPVLVLWLAGDPRAALDLKTLALVLTMLVAQSAFDFAGWVALGYSPWNQARALLAAWRVDLVLTPLGLALAAAGRGHMYAAMLGLPLVWLLGDFAREHTARIDQKEELSKAYRGTALLLGDMVEADDSYTGRHSHDVVSLVLAVCDRMGLDADSRRDAELAALLHDVGKVTIPKSIIQKPGPLTAEERSLIEQHTLVGERMLKRLAGSSSEVGSARALVPRALGRPRLPGRPGGRGDPPGCAHRLRLRRVERDDDRSLLPHGASSRGGPCRAAPVCRDAVRSARGRRPDRRRGHPTAGRPSPPPREPNNRLPRHAPPDEIRSSRPRVFGGGPGVWGQRLGCGGDRVGARMLVRGAVASCGLAAVIAAAGVVTAASASSHAVVLKGSAPAWAARAAVRPAKASGHVNVRVYLAPRGGIAALRAAVSAASTPGSATYGHYLKPAQYRARFEPTAAAVSSVSAWLRSAGLRVTAVEASHRYISASGSVAAAERAFGAKLNVYRHGGKLVRAPSTNARIPAAVAGSVLGVTGLSTAPVFVRPQIGPPPAGFRNARPCSKGYGTIPATVESDGTTPLPKFQGKVRDYAVCGYTPKQFRGAYGVTSSGLTGKGQTIGIVDAFAAGTILKDANTYATRHGDNAFAKGQFSQNMPKTFHLHPTQCQTPSDWAGEETLDVEAAHGMAPKANVIYYGAQSCLNQDLEFALARVDDQDKVTVVSNSYGSPMSSETSVTSPPRSR